MSDGGPSSLRSSLSHLIAIHTEPCGVYLDRLSDHQVGIRDAIKVTAHIQHSSLSISGCLSLPVLATVAEAAASPNPSAVGGLSRYHSLRE